MNKEEKPYQLGDMLKAFPMADLAKMIANIDRFDQDVPKERKDEIDAMNAAEEVSKKIIEEDL